MAAAKKAAAAKAAAKKPAKPAAGGMTAAQQRASADAARAQRTSNPRLKVLYLKRAIKNDPSNRRYRDLLKMAQAEVKAASR